MGAWHCLLAQVEATSGRMVKLQHACCLPGGRLLLVWWPGGAGAGCNTLGTTGDLPSLNFSKGAMSALERLELRFKRLEGLHGLDKLESIHDVIVTVDGQVEGTTKLILDELKKAQGKYVLNVHE
jgi:hypothetical protein